MEAEALLPLPVTLAHAAMVRGHKDPFDRLLVA
jgi:PIN domain nuclease of toxin-antitoxin system